MTLRSFYIQTVSFTRPISTKDWYTHCATDHGDMVLAICGIPHDSPVDFRDCPVASRWCLVRRTDT